MQEIADKLDGDSKSLIALLIVFMAITMVAGVFVLALWRYYKSMRQKQEELFKATLQAQEKERGRIAEDLHDDIGPRLSALKLSVDMLRHDFTSEERNTIIDETTEILDYVIKDIRIIVRNLAARYIGEKGIYQQLNEFRKQIENAASVKIEMEIEILKNPLDNDFAVNLYRIIQELINNSIKHSGCTRIDIICETGENNLNLIYKDNGKGFSEESVSKGLGLDNITTRVKLYKGHCELVTAQNEGTRYNISFDLKSITPHIAATN
ncbi:MAG: ATP-binding protein [Bacteroidia bacterium]